MADHARAIMAAFPRHKLVLDAFVARGEILGIGPFAERSGSLTIFRDRAAAEAFLAQDPFVLEGLIASYEMNEWADSLLG